VLTRNQAYQHDVAAVVVVVYVNLIIATERTDRIHTTGIAWAANRVD